MPLQYVVLCNITCLCRNCFVEVYIVQQQYPFNGSLSGTTFVSRYYYICLKAFFQDNVGKPALEG